MKSKAPAFRGLLSLETRMIGLTQRRLGSRTGHRKNCERTFVMRRDLLEEWLPLSWAVPLVSGLMFWQPDVKAQGCMPAGFMSPSLAAKGLSVLKGRQWEAS